MFNLDAATGCTLHFLFIPPGNCSAGIALTTSSALASCCGRSARVRRPARCGSTGGGQGDLPPCTRYTARPNMLCCLMPMRTGTHPVRGRRLELRVPEDAPQEVANLYWACTAADPAQRPSAREVVEALMRIDHPKQRRQAQQQGQEAQQGQQEAGLNNRGGGQEEGPGRAVGAPTAPAAPAGPGAVGPVQSVHFQADRQVSPFQTVTNPNW